jgi:hypothetical protein
MIRVAIVIAVDELRPDFSQVACSDWLSAHHTGGLRAGRPAIHQDESHVASPSAQQRRLPRMSLHRRFTAQAPCSEIPNFGKLPRSFAATVVRQRGVDVTICGRLPGVS